MSSTEILRLYTKGYPRLIIVQMVQDEHKLDRNDAEKLVNEVILSGKRRT